VKEQADDSKELVREKLRQFGLSVPAVDVYWFLLRYGAHTYQSLLKHRVVAHDELAHALQLLEYMLLVGQQQFREKERFYATNPRISWRWQEFQFVWDRVLTLVPVDHFPTLENVRDQKRMTLLRELQRETAKVYELRKHTAIEAKRGRSLVTDGEYAQVCAEAISLAKESIIAVDSPPHSTATLPVFWSAITDRCMNGVRYTRIVPISEVFLHGIDVVARDLEEVGVDLRIVNEELIRQRFYLVDRDIFVQRFTDHRRSKAIGRLSYSKQKVDRLRRYAEKLLSVAVPAQDLISECRNWVASRAARLSQHFGPGRHSDVFTEIAQLGKFAEFESDDLAVIRDLVEVEAIHEIDSGRYTLEVPDGAVLLLESSL